MVGSPGTLFLSGKMLALNSRLIWTFPFLPPPKKKNRLLFAGKLFLPDLLFFPPPLKTPADFISQPSLFLFSPAFLFFLIRDWQGC